MVARIYAQVCPVCENAYIELVPAALCPICRYYGMVSMLVEVEDAALVMALALARAGSEPPPVARRPHPRARSSASSGRPGRGRECRIAKQALRVSATFRACSPYTPLISASVASRV